MRELLIAGWLLLGLSLLLTGSRADRPKPGQSATTYYVRPDGGSPEQCTGLVDAPYPGSGTNQPGTIPSAPFPPAARRASPAATP